jgi:4-amino-4-deoxychorismate lyase
MIALLLNGQSVADVAHAISAEDRGLQYGDGVFETMLLRDGQVRYLADHYARLLLGCERLGIVPPTMKVIESDIAQMLRVGSEGVLKLIVTRGAGGRGYRSMPSLQPTRVLSLHALPAADTAPGITARWCDTRLARNPQLAGIKHLNRIEQVLAQNEWHDANIAEGLMLDTEGELICATAANVFFFSERTLVTPDLRFSGIRGVMRAQVLSMARLLKIDVEERSVWPQELAAASEVFVTNAIRGLRSVVRLDAQNWQIGPVTQQLTAALSWS